MPTVWPYWTTQYQVIEASETGMVKITNVWHQWTELPTTMTANGWKVVNAWNCWQTTGTELAHLGHQQQLTEEQVIAQQKAQARANLIAYNRAKARRCRDNIARRCAEKLLTEHLSERQRQEFEAHHHFHVETAGGRRRYRIENGTSGNVRLVKMEGERPAAKDRDLLREGVKLCAHVYHPEGRIPHADNMLAQKLLLESDGGEAEFLAMANVC